MCARVMREQGACHTQWHPPPAFHHRAPRSDHAHRTQPLELATRRTGHYDLLPQLGGLISLGEPNSRELKVLLGSVAMARANEGIDVSEGDKMLRHDCMAKWLNVYAELPHEGIGLCVANAFVEAFPERDSWAVQKPWRDSNFQNTPSELGAVFLQVRRCPRMLGCRHEPPFGSLLAPTPPKHDVRKRDTRRPPANSASSSSRMRSARRKSNSRRATSSRVTSSRIWQAGCSSRRPSVSMRSPSMRR